MVAEAAHSWADTGNEVFLMIANRRARRPADDTHPLGYGREAYVWSLIAALGLGLHQLTGSATPDAVGPRRLYLVADVDLSGDDPEPRLALRLRALEARIRESPAVVDCSLSLSAQDEPEL
jgi:hypothetical protein